MLTGVLIDLHTANWTGNQARFAFILERIGAYSYARTNGWMDDEAEETIRKFFN